MEYRKLIKFGNSSYIISLPNRWLKKNDLKKGDLVYFEETKNDELILKPREIINSEIEKKEITIVEYNMEDLRRKLVSAYIAGYDIMSVSIRGFRDLERIKSYLRLLMTFEIIDQTKEKIVAKDLLDINEISMKKLIKRIDIIVRSMFEDSRLIKNLKTVRHINELSIEVNKLVFLGQRTIKKCLDRPKLMENVGLSHDYLINSWEMLKSLKDISEGIKRISINLNKKKLKVSEVKVALEFYDKVYGEYIKSMNSYYKGDIKLAYEIASKKDKIVGEGKRIAEKFDNKHLVRSLERMKNIEILTRAICRCVYQ